MVRLGALQRFAKEARVVMLGGLVVALGGCAARQQDMTRWHVEPRIWGEVTLPGEMNLPAEGCRVWLVQNGGTVNQTEADKSGRYKMAGLPTGPFDVRANKGEGYVEYSYRAWAGRALDLQQFNKPSLELNIVLEGHHMTIVGSVVDTVKRAGIDSARVTVYPPTVGGVTTGPDGRFRISSSSFASDIPYLVRAIATGYNQSSSDSILVSGTGTVDVGVIELSARRVDEPTGPGKVDSTVYDPGLVVPQGSNP